MKLSIEEQADVTVVKLSGEAVDFSDAALLHDKLHELVAKNKKQVVVDLSKVNLMNSRGLGMLISGYTTMKNNQGDLKLANITKRIENLLVVTKLVTVFECYDSIQEAVDSYKKAGSKEKKI